MTLEQKAEEIVKANVRDSWNGSIERIAQLLRELEAARKVADAAVARQITQHAYRRIGNLKPVDYDARLQTLQADDEAYEALQDAIREYRALKEAK